MNPDQLMSHEEMRWSSMTEEQLARRLKRIINPDKLECFMNQAKQKDNWYLEDLALERKIDLGLLFRAKKEDSNGGLKIKAQIKEKWEVKKEKEISERFLDL